MTPRLLALLLRKCTYRAKGVLDPLVLLSLCVSLHQPWRRSLGFIVLIRFAHAAAFVLVRYKGITLTKTKNQTLFMQATSLEDSCLSGFSEVCSEKGEYSRCFETLSVGLDINKAGGGVGGRDMILSWRGGFR